MTLTEEQRTGAAIVVSILLHLLLFFLISYFNLLELFAAKPEKAVAKPIVLELTQPEKPLTPLTQPILEPEDEKKWEPITPKDYELVENPDANNQKPNNSDLAAEKSSTSSAPTLGKPAETTPQSIPDLARKPPETSNIQDNTSQDDLESLGITVDDAPGNITFYNQKTFDKNLLTNSPKRKNVSLEEQIAPEDLMFKKLPESFKGESLGIFAMNTTAWDWKPWFQAFFDGFEKSLVHPEAYLQEIIGSQTFILLKIAPSGQLLEYKVLKHEGHESLKNALVHASTAFAPYKMLPKDFPAEHLELVFEIHMVKSELRKQQLKQYQDQLERMRKEREDNHNRRRYP